MSAETRLETRTRRDRRSARRITFWAVVRGAGLALAICLVLVVKVVPFLFGGNSLIVLTGSMQPTLNPGDLIAIRPVAASEISVGDIVTFQPTSDDPTLITHRVVSKGVGPEGIVFTTQGDNNDAADAQIVAAQVQGIYMYRVPLIGFPLNAIGGVGSGTVVILAALLIAYAVYAIFAPGRRRSPSAGTGKAQP